MKAVTEDSRDSAAHPMDLSALLRSWRVDAGIKLQRSRPLPQKEVAEFMGVSERWYRSLEAGAAISLSGTTLNKLSEALLLGPDERMVLYGLALDGASVALVDEGGEAEEQFTLLRLVTAQTEFPAYLTDAAWNILGYNTMMAAWFPWVREPGANLMRWALADQRARVQILDWRSHAEVYVAMLRFARATASDQALENLINDILRDPECRQIWAQGPKVIAFRQGHRYKLALPHISPEPVSVVSQVLLPAYQHVLRYVVLLPQRGAEAAL
ncbi:helix-turn-helix domain-containing protein [Streptomyces candidus]|uniref:Transcriptional regulator with XRE-family HTH domain n=1 Tax=Streptomyces candidus TaxID=67283 RepID=A0A7X0HIE2_9ACTN|nr:helix-turn-helix transcriptional regulator [Streptomyces candidus]MBB6438048.1 transcriptional regulator with XRE-family HTH domain [Streptomyces candidus]GHH39502.1 transcriptional regulator [Streptomyces candidus]